MSANTVQYLTREGDMVDLIAFNYYGKTEGTTEAILKANPGLAEYEILPTGMLIVIPPMPTPKPVSTVQLWS